MEKPIISLFDNLKEFVSGNEQDIAQLRKLAHEVVNTYSHIPFIERYYLIQSFLLNSSGLIGENFFNYLTDELLNVLSAEVVFIGQIKQDFPNKIFLVNAKCKENVPLNFDYFIKESPCERVLAEKKDIFIKNIDEEYPLWYTIFPCKAKHYFGKPLLGLQSQVIGIFVAMFNEIPNELEWTKMLLELLSGRVSLELIHHATQQQLLYNEKRLHDLINTITDYLVINKVINNEVVETWHSPTCLAVTGYRSDEFLQNPYLWYEMIYDADKIYVKEKVEQIVCGYEVKAFEHRIVHKNGTIRWIRNTPVLFKNDRNQVHEFTNIVYDITELKQVELKLLEHEQQYRLLFDQMTNGLVLCEMIYDENNQPVDFRIIELNQSFEQITGSKREQLINKHALEFEQYIPLEWIFIFDSIAKGGPTKYLDRFFEPIKKHLSLRVYSPKQGFVAILVEDITEQIKYIQLIQESENRFKAVVEAMPDSIFVVFGEKILYSNDKALELTHAKTLDELMKFPFNHFVPDNFHEENKVQETQLYTLDREIKYVEIIIVPIEYNQLQCKQIIIRDVTEKKIISEALKRSEQRFIEAIEAVNDGIFEWNVKTNEIFFSPRNYLLLGYEPYEFEPNHYVWDSLIYPDEKNRNYQEIKKHLKGEIPYYEIEYRIKNKEGKYQWILERGKVVERDKDNFPIRIIGIHSDIDLRKKMNEELQIALNRAEESNRLKSAFLANMSHEIRTPMNGILGFAALLDNENLPADKRKMYVQVIQNSTQQLLSVVNDILDISKIESNQLTLLHECFNINQLFDDLLSYFNDYLVKKNISSIKLKYFKEIEFSNAFIISDKNRLQQILSHLIDNAIKFTEKGYVEFGYKYEKNKILFYVKDTGIGIPNDKQNIIFDLFRQIDETNTRRYGGTGIGLSICRGLVKLFGGDIWVESEINKGTVFYFTIPASLFAENSFENLSNNEIIPQNILIVEDVLENYLLLKEILEAEGCIVYFASNGTEAIKILKSNLAIDLVLLDIRLPDKSGFEVLKEIHSVRPKITVVAQTAYGMAEDKEKIIKAGFDGYVAKPIKKKELIDVLKNIVKK